MDMHKTVKTKIIAGMFLFAGLTFLGASLYIQNTESKYSANTKIKIAEQETRLRALVEIIDRDGADSVVNKIIQDCNPVDREKFDMLLGNLAQLQSNELIEVKHLFDSCGDFFSLKKAVMVSRLVREYEVYTDHIEILHLIDNSDTQEINLQDEQWGTLVDYEVQRSTLTTKLVAIQGEIIDALINGVRIDSDEMREMLKDAQTTKDTLIYLNDKADALRETIVSI